jgi:hypothetical protein
VVHSFEVLAGLEGLSGELAAQRITDAALREIRALHYEMLACLRAARPVGLLPAERRIHAAINAAAANPVLAHTYGRINARVQSLRFRTNQDERQVAARGAGARADGAGAGRRDGAALRRVLVQHLQHKRDTVLQLLRDGQRLLAPASSLTASPHEKRPAPRRHVPPPNEACADLQRRLRAENAARCCSTTASRGRYATDASIYQIMPVGVLVPDHGRRRGHRAGHRARD